MYFSVFFIEGSSSEVVSMTAEVAVVSPAGATFRPRLCRVRLSASPDQPMPCTETINSKTAELFSGDATKGAAWAPVCTTFGQGSLNGLVAFELPSQENIVDGASVDLSLAIWHGNQSIFVANKAFDVQGMTLAGLSVETALPSMTDVPYFSAYPILTTRNRDEEGFDSDEIIFVQFVIKPPPLSRGEYSYLLTPTADIKICKVEV
jgi:hypothetical protein